MTAAGPAFVTWRDGRRERFEFESEALKALGISADELMQLARAPRP